MNFIYTKWHHNIIMDETFPYCIFLGICENFDVSLDKDGSPSMFLKDENEEGAWWPICGHFFTDAGANLFCRRLNSNYEGGRPGFPNGPITNESALVGNCTEDDIDFSKCSGGCNKYKVGGICDSLNCSGESGKKVGGRCDSLNCTKGLSLIHISEPTRLRRSRMPSSA